MDIYAICSRIYWERLVVRLIKIIDIIILRYQVRLKNMAYNLKCVSLLSKSKTYYYLKLCINGLKDIFIIGSKGIPAQYGGYETFVDNLVTRQVSKDIKYHVACMTFNKKAKHYDYNGAECQEITIPNVGGAKAIIYDLKALNWSLE